MEKDKDSNKYLLTRDWLKNERAKLKQEYLILIGAAIFGILELAKALVYFYG